MVPIDPAELDSKLSLVRQSIDRSAHTLIESGSDPLALAVYSWLIQEHRISLVNSDRVLHWGRVWSRSVLVDGNVGRRLDEDIASAALAASSLVSTVESDEVERLADGLRGGLSKIKESDGILFGDPAYAAISVYAAGKLNALKREDLSPQVNRIIQIFQNRLAHGALFGLSFAIRQMDENLSTEIAERLRVNLVTVLSRGVLGYEDETYAAQALLALSMGNIPPPESMECIERVIRQSPGWNYLMSGVEDVLATGRSSGISPLSNLFRASLADVVHRYKLLADQRAQAVLFERFRGRRSLAAIAGFGFVAILAIVWTPIVWLVMPRISDTWRYWGLGDRERLSGSVAILMLLGWIFATYVAAITIVVLHTVWSMLIITSIESDVIFFDALRRRVVKVSRIWAGFVGVQILGLLLNLLVDPLRTALGGQSNKGQ